MKLDRLMGILTILLQNDRVTAPWLAEKFEVNRRTIGRDIDALCQAGIPIVTYQGAGGGISIAEGYKLDKSVLTVDELSNIVAALKGIGSVSEKSQVERTLDKLSVNKGAVISMKEPIVIDLAAHNNGDLTKKIELIKKAVIDGRLIEFDYYYHAGEFRRSIEPYMVVFQWSAWYVFGFCLKRQDWRLFKLARLWEVISCDESFLPREIPPQKRDFNSYFTDESRLVALFDPSVKHLIIDAYGPDGFTETDSGELRLEVGYTNHGHILAWLLGFGDKVRVLEPPGMAKEIVETAQKIIERYKQNSKT